MKNKSKSIRKSILRTSMMLPLGVSMCCLISCSEAEKNSPAPLNDTQTVMNQEEKVFTEADVMPVPKDGLQAFYSYISENLKQTEINKSGKVLISFKVNTDGKVMDAEVLKGMGEPYNSSALQVISNSPDWKPGMKDGKPVIVKMVIPITFQEKE